MADTGGHRVTATQRCPRQDGSSPLVVGVDTHKHSVTVAVVESSGASIEAVSFDNSSDGVAAALGWLRGLDGPVARVGIEGSAGHGRHLAAALVTAGIDVREVPPRRTAERRRARRRPKTDVEDAYAIARATAAEPGLGPVKTGGLGAAHEELAAVRAHRDMLVDRHRSMLNHAEAELGALPLALTDPQRSRTRKVAPRLRAVATAFTAGQYSDQPAPVRAHLVMLAELHTDTVEVSRRIRVLERQLASLITACGSTLLDEVGIGVVGAAVLLTEVGDPSRFRSEAAFNRWWGGAPVAVSSGEGHGQPVRHRLDLLGNRTVNSVVYTMSITQARVHEPAQTYLARKRGEGDTAKQARRSHKTLLGRRIIRRMWADRRHAMHLDTPDQIPPEHLAA